MSKIKSNLDNSKTTRTKYSTEFKAQVLEIWHSGVYETMAECARSYGINENTLYNWLHKTRQSVAKNESNSEVMSLKKELARTKMELEILKKAAIYFANHAK